MRKQIQNSSSKHFAVLQKRQLVKTANPLIKLTSACVIPAVAFYWICFPQLPFHFIEDKLWWFYVILIRYMPKDFGTGSLNFTSHMFGFYTTKDN